MARRFRQVEKATSFAMQKIKPNPGTTSCINYLKIELLLLSFTDLKALLLRQKSELNAAQ